MPKAKESVPHVYDDGVVSPERVAAFANDDEAAQLRALTRLRRRASGRVSNYLASMSLILALMFGGWALMTDVLPIGDPFWPTIPGVDVVVTERVGWIVFQLGVFAAFAFLFADIRRMTAQAENATALLAAYESELARRYSARGTHARRWRRAHPIHWR